MCCLIPSANCSESFRRFAPIAKPGFKSQASDGSRIHRFKAVWLAGLQQTFPSVWNYRICNQQEVSLAFDHQLSSDISTPILAQSIDLSLLVAIL